MAPSIERAAPADLQDVRSLLLGAGLPVAGLEATKDTLLVARTGQVLVGSAGLEMPAARTLALLRSVVVATDRRGEGLGTRLTEAAIELARGLGVRRLFLLTEAAEEFFARHGFARIDRAAVPPDVRESVEFNTACPASAICMVRSLVEGGEQDCRGRRPGSAGHHPGTP